ncbi:hypothetical protein HPT25_23550 [Bacillus sp. BRMEA1]|uniref:hypothetical protein n=1 Tax=Neobacillus endophyticus TaxID=2738405 RepID=UPI001567ADA9|nr:hypothetical protein [Neobacillus endophyticus]NRD80301.1 hypothetical protein [Neobacillus endophyticus]
MRKPLEYAQIYYNEVVYDVEQEWQRQLDDHERHLLIEGYRRGRTAEAENEIKILFAK